MLLHPADDSTSMKYAEDGARIGDLRNMLERIAEVACLFDTDGISIRAINRCETGHQSHGWPLREVLSLRPGYFTRRVSL